MAEPLIERHAKDSLEQDVANVERNDKDSLEQDVADAGLCIRTTPDPHLGTNEQRCCGCFTKNEADKGVIAGLARRFGKKDEGNVPKANFGDLFPLLTNRYCATLFYDEEVPTNTETKQLKLADVFSTHPDVRDTKFSKVYTGQFLRDTKERHKLVAIKVVEMSSSLLAASSIRNEVLCLRKLQDTPFFSKIVGTFQLRSGLCLVTDHSNKITIGGLVEKVGVLTEDVIRFYAAEITCALGFLHQNGMIHRSLSLHTTAIDHDGHLVLFDLSYLTFLPTTDLNVFDAPPYDYLAPEMVKGGIYNKTVDWWALGVIVYNCLYNRMPFSKGDDVDTLYRIVTNPPTFVGETTGSNIIDFCKALLIKKPFYRLGRGQRDAERVKEHPFFEGTDWLEMGTRQAKPPLLPDLNKVDSKVTLQDALSRGEACSHSMTSRRSTVVPGTKPGVFGQEERAYNRISDTLTKIPEVEGTSLTPKNIPEVEGTSLTPKNIPEVERTTMTASVNYGDFSNTRMNPSRRADIEDLKRDLQVQRRGGLELGISARASLTPTHLSGSTDSDGSDLTRRRSLFVDRSSSSRRSMIYADKSFEKNNNSLRAQSCHVTETRVQKLCGCGPFVSEPTLIDTIGGMRTIDSTNTFLTDDKPSVWSTDSETLDINVCTVSDSEEPGFALSKSSVVKSRSWDGLSCWPAPRKAIVGTTAPALTAELEKDSFTTVVRKTDLIDIDIFQKKLLEDDSESSTGHGDGSNHKSTLKSSNVTDVFQSSLCDSGTSTNDPAPVCRKRRNAISGSSGIGSATTDATEMSYQHDCGEQDKAGRVDRCRETGATMADSSRRLREKTPWAVGSCSGNLINSRTSYVREGGRKGDVDMAVCSIHTCSNRNNNNDQKGSSDSAGNNTSCNHGNAYEGTSNARGDLPKAANDAATQRHMTQLKCKPPVSSLSMLYLANRNQSAYSNPPPTRDDQPSVAAASRDNNTGSRLSRAKQFWTHLAHRVLRKSSDSQAQDPADATDVDVASEGGNWELFIPVEFLHLFVTRTKPTKPFFLKMQAKYSESCYRQACDRCAALSVLKETYSASPTRVSSHEVKNAEGSSEIKRTETTLPSDNTAPDIQQSYTTCKDLKTAEVHASNTSTQIAPKFDANSVSGKTYSRFRLNARRLSQTWRRLLRKHIVIRESPPSLEKNTKHKARSPTLDEKSKAYSVITDESEATCPTHISDKDKKVGESESDSVYVLEDRRCSILHKSRDGGMEVCLPQVDVTQSTQTDPCVSNTLTDYCTTIITNSATRIASSQTAASSTVKSTDNKCSDNAEEEVIDIKFIQMKGENSPASNDNPLEVEGPLHVYNAKAADSTEGIQANGTVRPFVSDYTTPHAANTVLISCIDNAAERDAPQDARGVPTMEMSHKQQSIVDINNDGASDLTCIPGIFSQAATQPIPRTGETSDLENCSSLVDDYVKTIHHPCNTDHSNEANNIQTVSDLACNDHASNDHVQNIHLRGDHISDLASNAQANCDLVCNNRAINSHVNNDHISNVYALNDPISNNRVNNDPISSDNVNNDPTSSDNVNNDPISSDNVNNDPISSDNVNNDPISSDNAINDQASCDIARNDHTTNVHTNSDGARLRHLQVRLTRAMEDRERQMQDADSIVPWPGSTPYTPFSNLYTQRHAGGAGDQAPGSFSTAGLALGDRSLPGGGREGADPHAQGSPVVGTLRVENYDPPVEGLVLLRMDDETESVRGE